MSRQQMFHVWNVTMGYVEHIGSLHSCHCWIRNARDLSADRFEIREGRPPR